MSNLPILRSDVGRPSRALARAARATERTELAIYKHHLSARYQAECDEIDSKAIADVVETALREEMRVLDSSLARAGNSPAKRELVARMSALHSDIDMRRIGRRFGR
jgi:uncharacterized protein YcsI (UPF0317 family)